MPIVSKSMTKDNIHRDAQPKELSNATMREQPCRAIIRFPWGDATVDALLRIGRDADYSSLAPQLREFVFISRRHAEIARDGNRFLLNDAGSLNFSFVNGRKLTPGEPVELRPGDKLKFASQVEAEVLEIRGGS
jgi:hypothetical protein